MGVDSNLYLPLDIPAGVIAYAVAKAAGVEPPTLDDGSVNVFQGNKYIVCHPDNSPAEFHTIEVKEAEPPVHFYLHLTNDNPGTPLGAPCWTVAGRCNPRNIAILRTLAEGFGGLLEWRDSNSIAMIYSGPEERGFLTFQRLSLEMPTAQVTPEDTEHSMYR